jgi:hypothetical protein
MVPVEELEDSWGFWGLQWKEEKIAGWPEEFSPSNES